MFQMAEATSPGQPVTLGWERCFPQGLASRIRRWAGMGAPRRRRQRLLQRLWPHRYGAVMEMPSLPTEGFRFRPGTQDRFVTWLTEKSPPICLEGGLAQAQLSLLYTGTARQLRSGAHRACSAEKAWTPVSI
jgi:hypothetical protein